MATSDELRDVRLVQKFNLEALECNEKLEEKWKQFRKDYEDLKTCLEEFPKELSVPIMMPIGSKVFVRAQLCNTNEVFIRYDEIFTKQTAYEAKAVCERHIKRCDGMIENLAKEKKLLSDNLCARLDIATESSDDLKEIIEPYDEEKELAWKEVHRQKVKEYKQQLLDNKTNQIDNDCKKVMHEFEKAGVNKQLAGTYAKSNLFESYHIHCGRNPMETTIDSDDNSSSESSDDDISNENEDDFDVDDEEDDDSKLEIVFTNDVPETTRNLRKKIKKKVSFNVDVEVKEFEPRPEEHFIRRKEETESPEVMVTQINDIVERVTDTSLENNTEPVDDEDNVRPVSRFKANRKKINTSK